MTPRINLDPRRIQVWQKTLSNGATFERITWFNGAVWRCTFVNHEVGMGTEEDWRSISALGSWLVTRSYTELTARSDA